MEIFVYKKIGEPFHFHFVENENDLNFMNIMIKGLIKINYGDFSTENRDKLLTIYHDSQYLGVLKTKKDFDNDFRGRKKLSKETNELCENIQKIEIVVPKTPKYATNTNIDNYIKKICNIIINDVNYKKIKNKENKKEDKKEDKKEEKKSLTIIIIILFILIFVVVAILSFLYILSVLIAFVYIAKKERLSIKFTGNYSKSRLILYPLLGPLYFLF